MPQQFFREHFGGNNPQNFRGQVQSRIAGIGPWAKEYPVPAAIGGLAGGGLLLYGAYRAMAPNEFNPGNLNDPTQRQVVENSLRRGQGHDPAPARPQPQAQMDYQRVPSQVEQPRQMYAPKPTDIEIAKERMRLYKNKEKAMNDLYFAAKYQQTLGYSPEEGF